MVKKEDRQKMQKFLINRLEEAEKYMIVKSDTSHILLAQKPDLVENPLMCYILLHNNKLTEKDYQNIVNNNALQGIYTSTVHFKDGILNYVPAAAKGHLKNHGKSLKHYSPQEINKMIKLRTPEKKTLEYLSPSRIVNYYQPESSNLEEAIKGTELKNVKFDYSHLRPGDPGYGFSISGTTSKEFKIADEEFLIVNGGIELYQPRTGKMILNLKPTK